MIGGVLNEHKFKAGQRVKTEYGLATLTKPIMIEGQPAWLMDCDDGGKAATREARIRAVKVGRGE